MALLPRVREMLQRKEIFGQKKERYKAKSINYYTQEDTLSIITAEGTVKTVHGVTKLKLEDGYVFVAIKFESDRMLVSITFEYVTDIECENGVCVIK